MSDVAIVGGGIAGLALAEALGRAAPPGELRVVVLERSDRVGGNIRTERIDGFLCERGPNGFLDNVPATLALVRRLGIEDRLLPSDEAARRRFIFSNGRLQEVPGSPAAFARTGLLSWRGKLRVLGEAFAPAPPPGDESIFGFAERRIGREAAAVLVDPMVAGIFGGDARRLSLGACFPKMAWMEREFGSLTRAALKGSGVFSRLSRARRNSQPLGMPGGRLTSFTGGMEELPRALAAHLGGTVRVGLPVTGVARVDPAGPRGMRGRYRLQLARHEPIDADAVVLAGPAAESAAIVRGLDAPLAGLLGQIVTAPLAVVCVGYPEAGVVADRGALDGFGFLVPSGEGRRILGAVWDSSVYRGRAPQGHVLARVMLGGARDPGALALTDPELVHLVREELAATMGLRIAPRFVHVFRHPRGIPQYTLGHLDRSTLLEQGLARHPGLFLAGNSYRGVSVNACIEDAAPLAERVLQWARTTQTAGNPAVAAALHPIPV